MNSRQQQQSIKSGAGPFQVWGPVCQVTCLWSWSCLDPLAKKIKVKKAYSREERFGGLWSLENCAVLWKCYDLTHPGLVGKWFKGTLEELQNVFPVMKRHRTSASWRPKKHIDDWPGALLLSTISAEQSGECLVPICMSRTRGASVCLIGLCPRGRSWEGFLGSVCICQMASSSVFRQRTESFPDI